MHFLYRNKNKNNRLQIRIRTIGFENRLSLLREGGCTKEILIIALSDKVVVEHLKPESHHWVVVGITGRVVRTRIGVIFLTSNMDGIGLRT